MVGCGSGGVLYSYCSCTLLRKISELDGCHKIMRASWQETSNQFVTIKMFSVNQQLAG